MAVRSILKLAAEQAAKGEDVVSQVVKAPFLRGSGFVPPPSDTEFTGNAARLMLGQAQHIRVNDANASMKPDRFGHYPNEESQVGLARNRVEIGGPMKDAGMLFGRYLGCTYMELDWQKQRIARIVKSFPSHMHNVCYSMHLTGKGRWLVEFEHLGGWKDMMNGDSTGADPFVKMTVGGFSTSQAAIAYCHEFGFGYELEIPRARYHVRKSYADNFKWRGPDNS